MRFGSVARPVKLAGSRARSSAVLASGAGTAFLALLRAPATAAFLSFLVPRSGPGSGCGRQVQPVGTGNAASITLDPATTGAVWNDAHDNADTMNASSIANIRYIAKHALDNVKPSAAGGISLGAGFGC
jgi:hypothetical protein